MKLEEHEFGRAPGDVPVRLIRAIGAGGLEVAVATYGATLVSVRAPDRNGRVGEITLGFDSLEGYLGKHPYYGATVGRYANRITNASFELNGTTVEVTKNSGAHHLHGGSVGFNRVVWESEVTADSNRADIAFHHQSPAGHEGYPGNLDVTVTYTVSDDNLLRVAYVATTDEATPVNLTNHTYWNLDRPGVDVRDHLVKIHADRYLWVDNELLPDGRVLRVDDTPYDLRTSTRISDGFDEAGGYDNNFVVNGEPGTVRPAAEVVSPATGRRMTVATDQPSIQFYTTNMMDDIEGRNGVVFSKYGALCLETGGYNDAVNHPEFPSTILEPGHRYVHVTEHHFDVM